MEKTPSETYSLRIRVTSIHKVSIGTLLVSFVLFFYFFFFLPQHLTGSFILLSHPGMTVTFRLKLSTAWSSQENDFSVSIQLRAHLSTLI